MKYVGAILTAIVIATLSAGVAFGLYRGMQKLPIVSYFSGKQTNAVWDWRAPDAPNQSAIADQADQLQLHQINTVYVNITETAAGDPNEKLQAGLSEYVKVMKAHGIKVYGAAGDTTWSNPDQTNKPANVLNWVYAYNQAHADAALSGVEFDIETYNQPSFLAADATARSQYLGQYLDMAAGLVKEQQAYLSAHPSAKISLGFTVPYWYDNENGNIQNVDWNGKSAPVVFHLIDTLKALSDSNVVVMSYRNIALGNDGSVNHARTEVEYASAEAPGVKILIGQETNKVTPEKVTFYGSSKTDLSHQANIIAEQFQNDGAFGGFAINDMAGYLELRN